MEIVLLLIGLLVLVAVFLPWINAARIGMQREEIKVLMRRVMVLESARERGNTSPMPKETSAYEEDSEEVFEPEQEAPSVSVPFVSRTDEVTKDISEDPFRKKTGKQEEAPSEPFVYSSERHISKVTDMLSRGFEMNIAAKLPVWIGALSLILGIVFLVKYSIEVGLLSPFVRVCLGAMAGTAMIAAGQWIFKRDYIANAVRISQGLLGAGLVALYASIYAAVSLYGFFPPIFGFAGMAIVSAMAVIFSLRHGQPIAVFGLIGGFLTPAFVGGEPNTLALFGYLFIFFAFMFGMMMRKGWWTLCIVSLVAGFGWPLFWLAVLFNAAEVFIVLLFVMGLTGIVLAATGRYISETAETKTHIKVHALNILALTGCVLTIFWIDYKVTLSLFEWSMMGLLSAATMALAFFQPKVYQKALFVKVAVTLTLLAAWIGKVSFATAFPVILGLFVLYVIGSALIIRQNAGDPRPWALLQTLSAGALYTFSYLFLDLPVLSISEETLYGFLALGLAVAAINQAANWRRNNHEHMTAIYVLTASAFISGGFVILLPWGYAAMAIAGQLLATAWVYRQTDIPVLNPVLYGLIVGFLVLSLDQIILFADFFGQAIFDDMPSRSVIVDYVLEMPVLQLGLPAICFVGAIHLLSQKTEALQDRGIVILTAKVCLALLLALSYYVVRLVFDQNSPLPLSHESGFIERGVMTITCFGVGYGFLKYIQKEGLSFLKPLAMLVFAFVAGRFIWFDFVIDNPYLDGAQKVGAWPLFNGITLTYGAATLFAVWMIKHNFSFKFPKVYIVLAAISFLTMISFHVRHFYNGDELAQGNMSMEEFYTYSVVWLVSGLVSLSIGIHNNISALRLAATALIGATICKVFLLDAAHLEGLYRVFSFIGLGLSLIGLSFFYTKFVIRQDRNAEPG